MGQQGVDVLALTVGDERLCSDAQRVSAQWVPWEPKGVKDAIALKRLSWSAYHAKFAADWA
jgi:hypothetical protein